MNPSIHFSLLFTLSLIIISHVVSQPSPTPPPAPALGTPLYQIVCKDAGTDNDRCLKLLEPYREITSAKDYVQLCKFILQMAIKKATRGQNYMKEQVKKYPSSKAIKQCASSNYDELVNSFSSSLNELVLDPLTANYDAKVAGDGPNDCDSYLGEEKMVHNPTIDTLNNNMSFLSLVAFYATNHLPGQ